MCNYCSFFPWGEYSDAFFGLARRRLADSSTTVFGALVLPWSVPLPSPPILRIAGEAGGCGVTRGLRCLIPGPRCLGGHRSRVAGPRGCFWPHIGASGVPDCSGSPRGRPERCGAVGDISATDWEAIARQAEAAGDREGAQAARKVAERGGVAGNGQESVFAIAKKLAKLALKHGRIFCQRPFALGRTRSMA